MKVDVLYSVLIFAALLAIGLGLQCWECNVWKAGYGHLCSNPRVRDDCSVCIKTEATIYIGYFKNTPRKSKIVSRVCAKSKQIRFSHECHHYTMSDGHGKRCYCDNDLCNSAPKGHIPGLSIWILGLSTSLVLLCQRVRTFV